MRPELGVEPVVAFTPEAVPVAIFVLPVDLLLLPIIEEFAAPELAPKDAP